MPKAADPGQPQPTRPPVPGPGRMTIDARGAPIMARASRRERGMGDLEAPITAVTVFRDGARVTRAGAADLAAGLQPVVIRGLPASLDRASVRVALRGEDVALLEVEVNREY